MRVKTAVARESVCAWQLCFIAAVACNRSWRDSGGAWQRLRMAAVAHGSGCAWQRCRLAAAAHDSARVSAAENAGLELQRKYTIQSQGPAIIVAGTQMFFVFERWVE